MAKSSQGQFASRVKGKERCIHHQEILKFVCKNCQDLVCIKCVTSLHSEHDFYNLKDIVPEAKWEIKSFIDNTEKTELPYIQQAIVEAKDILKKDTAHFDDLEKDVTNQLEILKQDLEVLSANIISSYRKLKMENTELLTNYIKAFETRQEEFNRYLNECKAVLQTESHVNIYDVRNEIAGLEQLTGKLTLSTASFVPNKEPLDNLKMCFGTVTINATECQDPVHLEGAVGHQQPSSTLPQKSTTINRAQIVYNILANTKVITEFKPPCDFSAICTTNDGQVYSLNNNRITRLNTKGQVRKKIKYKVRISHISVSPATQHIWTCSYEDCSVMECVPSHKPVVRFNTDSKPYCLCVTSDNCILIGMSKQITKYTTEGEILLTTKLSETGQPAVTTPVSITECSVTHNIAVAELDNKEEGGDDKPHVLVMDNKLKEVVCYRGEIPTKYQRTITYVQRAFYPCDVRYDNVGNLVVRDCYRDCVHLLGGDGDYLTLIYTDDTGIGNIDIDVNNVLWVVTGFGNKVKLLQYCNTHV